MSGGYQVIVIARTWRTTFYKEMKNGVDHNSDCDPQLNLLRPHSVAGGSAGRLIDSQDSPAARVHQYLTSLQCTAVAYGVAVTVASGVELSVAVASGAGVPVASGAVVASADSVGVTSAGAGTTGTFSVFSVSQ